MGGGDIKLIAVFGLHFGIWKILLLIIAACVFGLLGAAITRTRKEKEFPFGPAISLAAWFTALFGSFLNQCIRITFLTEGELWRVPYSDSISDHTA